MDAGAERRYSDLRKLEALCAASDGRVRLVAHSGAPPTQVDIELQCRTAGSSEYPREAITRVRARINLPARYPLHQPQVLLTPVVFHPNVYASGAVCLGATWLPTEGLDLLVKRLAHIITFDPAVVNAVAPANASAGEWYRTAVTGFPSDFPTDDFGSVFEPRRIAKPVWKDLTVVTSNRAGTS
jgi:hypothetical protein